MEFKEYTNPESKDYDITSSLNSITSNTTNTDYFDKLTDLIGILEDIDDKSLQEEYGITMDEYLNPTESTIAKVVEKLNSTKHR